MDVLLGDNDVGVSLSCALRAQTQLFAEVVIGTSTLLHRLDYFIPLVCASS